METQKQWLAVYTKPRWEKKISLELWKRNIENYCPVNKVIKQRADRKKTVYEPLLSCYVFVRVEPAEYLAIKKTDGILNFIYWLGKPAVIKDEEINAMKDFLDQHQAVALEKINVRMNDVVRIIEGPLSLREGNILEVRKNTVKITLPTLGYALIAEVPKSNIEVISVYRQEFEVKH